MARATAAKSVEDGVIADFGKWGIKEPVTTLECLAIKLAQLLDELRFANDQKNVSPATLARELRQTMKEIEDIQANASEEDTVRTLMDKNR